MIMSPLIPAAPLVGGLQVFFLNRPVSTCNIVDFRKTNYMVHVMYCIVLYHILSHAEDNTCRQSEANWCIFCSMQQEMCATGSIPLSFSIITCMQHSYDGVLLRTS